MKPGPPLVIDLDGTLLKADLLMETWLLFVRDQPHRVLAPLRWLSQGKAALKQQLALATELDISVLPYEKALIEFIEAERECGRKIVLATASHRHLAHRVAEHLALFDEVIATDEGRNLSAGAKRDALVEMYGDTGYDYAGNSHDDLHVWSSSRQAYVVNASPTVERRARELGNVARVFNSGRPALRDWVKALRVHQWLKNLLIFVPLLAAHRHTEIPLLIDALLAFLCFCLCASSVYILNDLLDLRDDRKHIHKRSRPFASGRLSILSGVAVFPALLVSAFAIALSQLPLSFVAVLATYYTLTLAYSFSLKRRMVVDVIALAALYTLRIVAGAFALGIPLSFWLLALSMFAFLSLALVKRYSELAHMNLDGKDKKINGRGYFADDLQIIASLGTASGYMAVMVLALYINDAGTAKLYSHQEIIWLACPLLLTWFSRIWMLAHRGKVSEDPVIFAAKDRVSLLVCALLAIIFLAAR